MIYDVSGSYAVRQNAVARREFYRTAFYPFEPELPDTPQEDRGYVSFVQILGHVLRDDVFVSLEQFEVAAAHIRCDLKSNVQQLTEAAVVCDRPGNVTQSGRIFFRGPSADLFRRRQLRRIDVDD